MKPLLLLSLALSLTLVPRCSAQNTDNTDYGNYGELYGPPSKPAATKQPAAAPVQKSDKVPVAKLPVVELEHGPGESPAALDSQDRELIDQVNARRVADGIEPLRTVDTMGLLFIYKDLYGELKQQLARPVEALAVGEHDRVTTHPVKIADLKEGESAMTVSQLVQNYNNLEADYADLGRNYHELLDQYDQLLDAATKYEAATEKLLGSRQPTAPVYVFTPAPPPQQPVSCVTQYVGNSAYTNCN